jgi:hypothetical protein
MWKLTDSWSEIETIWRDNISSSQLKYLRYLAATFDDAWLKEQADLLRHEHTAHHLYRWLVAPLNLSGGGGDRILALGEALRIIQSNAGLAAWGKKASLLVRRLKSYSSKAHFAFFDQEFEVFHLAKMLSRSPSGIRVLDLESPLPSGQSADVLVSFGSREVFQEFKALEQSGENERIAMIVHQVFDRLRRAIPKNIDGYELQWKLTPSDDQIEEFFERLQAESHKLEKEGDAFDHPLATVVIRKGSAGIQWHPSEKKSRLRILKQLVGARNKFDGVRAPILIKLKLYWSDNQHEQLDQAAEFLRHPKSSHITAIVFYDHNPVIPIGCMMGQRPVLTEEEIRQLA